MKSLLLYITLLLLAACLISCQKDPKSFKSIYSNNDIDKIIIKDTNYHFKEITAIERIIKWAENVDELSYMHGESQEERDFLLTYDGCSVKAYHQNEELGDEF